MSSTDPSDATRISVESRYDVLHLRKNISRFAAEALQGHALAKQQAGKPTGEKLRSRVQTIIDKWIEDAFAIAGDSIMINGVAYSVAMNSSHDMEPLDRTLVDAAQKAEAEFEELALKVAEKRRHAPHYLGNLIKETVALGTETALSAVSGDEVKVPGVLDDASIETLRQVSSDVDGIMAKEEFDDTLSRLRALTRDAPVCLNRFERLEELAHDILTSHPSSTRGSDPAAMAYITSRVKKAEKRANMASNDMARGLSGDKGETGGGQRKAAVGVLRAARKQRHGPY